MTPKEQFSVRSLADWMTFLTAVPYAQSAQALDTINIRYVVMI